MIYDKSYFNENNYVMYLDRSGRYKCMIEELHYDLFRKLKLDFIKEPVLDFGCAVGFCVAAFEELGYQDLIGYDISEWAVNWGNDHFDLKRPLTTDYESVRNAASISLMLSLDVFEHMQEQEIKKVLTELKPHNLLVRIPLADEKGKFILKISENDPTHIIRWTKDKWLKFFVECGYIKLFDINLGMMYDTEAVMCTFLRK